jgi:hypothetical protein
MVKKSVQRIPKSVILVCPHCKKGTVAKVSTEFSPQKYICPKCKEEVRTPIAQCCIICAFSKSGTKCPRELYMKAKVRGWTIK